MSSPVIIVCVAVRARGRIGRFDVRGSFDLISQAIRYHLMPCSVRLDM